MSSDAPQNADTLASSDVATDTHQSAAQEAFHGLPDHLVVTHILRSEYFDDPADLATLRVVSRAMRDTVAATGLRFEELGEDEAVVLGILSALQRRQRQGRLSYRGNLCAAAARSGQLEELKLLRADGCPCNIRTSCAAATGGHLEVLQWLRGNGRCPWNIRMCSAAAQGGHLEVLQWLRANGCPWDATTCYCAARGGHLEVLQWLRANGCPWGRFTCSYAAYYGHLAVLQWARANGCPWDRYTYRNAALGGHLEMLQWLCATGCPEE